MVILPENCTKWEEYSCVEDDCLADDFEKIPFGLLILLLFCYLGHFTLSESYFTVLFCTPVFLLYPNMPQTLASINANQTNHLKNLFIIWHMSCSFSSVIWKISWLFQLWIDFGGVCNSLQGQVGVLEKYVSIRKFMLKLVSSAFVAHFQNRGIFT